MKIKFLFVLLVIGHSIFGQVRTKYVFTSSSKSSSSSKSKRPGTVVKSFLSDFQTIKMDNQRARRTQSVKIDFFDPKSRTTDKMTFDQAPNGYIAITYPNGDLQNQKYPIKYLRQDDNPDGRGIISSYCVVDDNSVYNLIDVTDYNGDGLQLGNNSYKHVIEFLAYKEGAGVVYSYTVFAN